MIVKSILLDFKEGLVFFKNESNNLFVEIKKYILNYKNSSQEKISQIKGSISKKIKDVIYSEGFIITLIVVIFSLVKYRLDLSNYYLSAIYLSYTIYLFLRKIDSRYPISAALLLLAATPFYLIRNLEDYANYLATLAYLFLVIGVIKQFIEYLKDEKKP